MRAQYQESYIALGSVVQSEVRIERPFSMLLLVPFSMLLLVRTVLSEKRSYVFNVPVHPVKAYLRRHRHQEATQSEPRSETTPVMRRRKRGTVLG